MSDLIFSASNDANIHTRLADNLYSYINSRDSFMYAKASRGEIKVSEKDFVFSKKSFWDDTKPSLINDRDTILIPSRYIRYDAPNAYRQNVPPHFVFNATGFLGEQDRRIQDRREEEPILAGITNTHINETTITRDIGINLDNEVEEDDDF